MGGYTKLFASILDSSVWQEDSDTRCVWITLLAMAGARGIVEASVPGIAHRARVPLETCERALTRFQDADRYSRSQEMEGRRIVAVPGGFQLVNHAQYRLKLNADERREYRRQWIAERRAAVNSVSTDVDTCEQSRHKQKQKQKQKQEKNVSSEAPAAPSEPAAMIFPCVGQTQEWTLTDAQVREWQGKYPTLSVFAECQKAHAWVLANQRKTARGMPAFLVRWLNKATDERRTGMDRRAQDRRAPSYHPTANADYDRWPAECRELHGGACGNYPAHQVRMARAS